MCQYKSGTLLAGATDGANLFNDHFPPTPTLLPKWWHQTHAFTGAAM